MCEAKLNRQYLKLYQDAMLAITGALLWNIHFPPDRLLNLNLLYIAIVHRSPDLGVVGAEFAKRPRMNLH